MDINLDNEAAHLRTLLNADYVCYWRTLSDSVAIAAGCAPAQWVCGGFLMPPAPPEVRISTGAQGFALLPLMLRGRLPDAPAAVLTAPCGGAGGIFAVWLHAEAVPREGSQVAHFAHAAYVRLLGYAHAAEFAQEAHLQMREIVAALPQGVVIVPNASATGYLNRTAAGMLGLDEGEIGVARLAEALRQLATRACNAAEVQRQIGPLLKDAALPLMSGVVWRFAQTPRALRVTVAPIGVNARDGWVWLLEDVGGEVLAQDLLAEREEKFRHFYQGLQDAVVFTDLDGRLVEWNTAFQSMLGYSEAQLASLSLAQITNAPWTATQSNRVAAQVRQNGYSESHEKELRCVGDKTIIVEARTFLRKDAAGNAVGMWEVVRDITARKSAEAQLVLAAQVFDRSAEGVVLTDPDLRILTVNEAFCAMSGYARDELVGQHPRLLQSGHHDESFYRALWEQVAAKDWWQGEVWNRNKNGDIFLKWLSINAIRDQEGIVTHYVGMYRNAEVVAQGHQRIEYLATHDGLTGLPNRLLFDDRLQLALRRAERQQSALAILFIDLDEFKTINDTLGHRVGDALLAEAARRISACVRPGDTVARTGGDEFCVLMDVAADGEVVALCERILAALPTPFTVDALEVALPASIGVSFFPGDGRDAETLLRKADTALYRAKLLGKNTYRFFTEDMAEQVNQQFRIESGLRQAIARGELFLQYQPQIALSASRLASCEALVRWRRDGAVVAPGRFIPVAEKSSLIVDLTEWVLGEACRQLAAWHAEGFALPQVSVNLPARYLKLDGLVARLKNHIDATGLTPAALCLEITEGALMEPASCEDLLHAIKAAGFSLSIDDFGTGYSSLSYLKRFPIDELKIDGSFVAGIETDVSDRAIITATLAMARSLGMRVVAEGVENAPQLAYLREQQCDIVQGYFFSRPLNAADFRSCAAQYPLETIAPC